jgi:hypothetical protein
LLSGGGDISIGILQIPAGFGAIFLRSRCHHKKNGRQGLAATDERRGKAPPEQTDHRALWSLKLFYWGFSLDLVEHLERSFTRLAASRELVQLYNKWLQQRLPTGETLDLPMSPQLEEIFRVEGVPDRNSRRSLFVPRQPFEVSGIVTFTQMAGEDEEALAVDIAHMIGDLFDAGDLEALAHLDRAHERRGRL